MSAPSPDIPLAMSTATAEPHAMTAPEREPRGYRGLYFFASIGLFLATFAPGLGGMAVKIL